MSDLALGVVTFLSSDSILWSFLITVSDRRSRVVARELWIINDRVITAKIVRGFAANQTAAGRAGRALANLITHSNIWDCGARRYSINISMTTPTPRSLVIQLERREVWSGQTNAWLQAGTITRALWDVLLFRHNAAYLHTKSRLSHSHRNVIAPPRHVRPSRPNGMGNRGQVQFPVPDIGM